MWRRYAGKLPTLMKPNKNATKTLCRCGLIGFIRPLLLEGPRPAAFRDEPRLAGAAIYGRNPHDGPGDDSALRFVSSLSQWTPARMMGQAMPQTMLHVSGLLEASSPEASAACTAIGVAEPHDGSGDDAVLRPYENLLDASSREASAAGATVLVVHPSVGPGEDPALLLVEGSLDA